ncbi:MAG TPA: flavodoxin domain-containing protein [Mycobacteriales bacterium]|nr:flavodoxin domain-containing protein [Mycobacteriales bacterium]
MEQEVIGMRARVVYESMFGNTKQVAEAVGEGLSSRLSVDVVEVGTASCAFDDVELLVVGGPTHAFGMSRQNTRHDARRQGQRGGHPVGSIEVGVREWLAEARPGPGGTAAAAFDTRVGKSWMPGSAAHGADKLLRRQGFGMAARPESFWVTDTFGPLRPGELERARQWGEDLAAAAAAEAGRGAGV